MYRFVTLSGDSVAQYTGPLDKMTEACDATAQVLGVALAVYEVKRCEALIWHGPGHQSLSQCEEYGEHDEHSAMGGHVTWDDDE